MSQFDMGDLKHNAVCMRAAEQQTEADFLQIILIDYSLSGIRRNYHRTLMQLYRADRRDTCSTFLRHFGRLLFRR